MGCLIGNNYFNSHAHVERDVEGVNWLFWNHNFNSHAHVERDADDGNRSEYKIISTHTLTWSVTGYDLYSRLLPKISTHTLTWSVTKSLD